MSPMSTNSPMTAARSQRSKSSATCHISVFTNSTIWIRSSSGRARPSSPATAPSSRTVLPERPAGERDEAVAGDEVDRAEEQEVDDRDRQTLRPLPADHGGRQRRREHEDGDLREAHPGGAGEGRPTPQHVRCRPTCPTTIPMPPRAARTFCHQVKSAFRAPPTSRRNDEGEDRERPGEDVLGGAVALHEVRSASSHEPPLHRARSSCSVAVTARSNYRIPTR